MNRFLRIRLTLVAASLAVITSCEIMPRNTLKDCQAQCNGSRKRSACLEFCACIHKKGEPLNRCLDVYNSAAEDSVRTP